jgi:hypothetical protein
MSKYIRLSFYTKSRLCVDGVDGCFDNGEGPEARRIQSENKFTVARSLVSTAVPEFPTIKPSDAAVVGQFLPYLILLHLMHLISALPYTV